MSRRAVELVELLTERSERYLVDAKEREDVFDTDYYRAQLAILDELEAMMKREF